MKEHFDSKVIQDLVKLYNRSLSKAIDGIGVHPDFLSDVKEDVLMGALDYCYKHKSKFDPSKGNALAFFATIVRSYVIVQVSKIKKGEKKYISIRRERRINDLLGIPNPEPTHITYNI
jgi:hypothetical protein